MTMTNHAPDEAIDNEMEPVEAEKPVKLDKAAKLEAKAARLREAEAAKSQAAELGTVRRGPWVAAVAGLGVLAVLLMVAAGLLFAHSQSATKQRNRLAALDAARSSAIVAATQYAAQFGTYDYQNLDSQFAAVDKLLTPEFLKSYQQITALLKPTLIASKGITKGTVAGVGVVKVNSPTDVELLVFLDQTKTTATDSTPKVEPSRLDMQLVKVNGTWLIKQLNLK
jgi:Mce-associated membrane protein